VSRWASRIRWASFSAARIALIYAAVSVSWILGSDHLALLLAGDNPQTLAKLQQYKGLFFVLTSSGLIFFLVHDHHRRLVRTQRQLAARDRELLQAQKMEAVGLLAGGVAHDFNNLLQVINGRAELVLEDREIDAATRSALEQIAGAGDRAANLVGQLLAFSRRQILAPDDLDLNEVVATLLKLLERVLGEHIRVEFLPGHQLGTVHVDRGQVEQVLMNLCINARDAMPQGGTLTLETENVRFDAEYCQHHLWAEPGRYVLLSVTDDGTGMDAPTLARIWEPFFTTKEADRGTGLGLSTVYGIIRQHGGLMHVYSEPGRGTTFKIYLPLVERPAASVGTKVRAPVLGGSETILVAEDNESVRDLMQSVLTRAGYEILLCVDGQQAWQVLEARDGAVDLVLLDVVMPGLSGPELLARAQARWPQLRFLLASGYSLNGAHTDSVLQQGVTMIQKPFESRELLAEVRRLLDGE
jgi:two-component system, cell cycle sensor histidine kinase and response regulator CckA